MSSENLISLALTQSILNANATTQSSSQTSSSFSSTPFSLIGSFNQSSISHMDELVKEYLLFRGFNGTLKAFEHDLKLDKDRSFRADKITDQLLHYIYSHDLTNLVDYWSYLDQRYFNRISLKVSATKTTALTRKYELFLFRFYLIHALQTGKLDKVMDFFENYANKLQSQNEWRDWYCLPFLKNPDENPAFAVYFNKSWTDTFIVSLQNFLNIVFQSLPFPRLLNYDEESYWNKQAHQQSSKKSDVYPNIPGQNSFVSFEQEYVQSELIDQFQLLQIKNGLEKSTSQNTFISMIKFITLNKSQQQSEKVKPSPLSIN